MDKSALIRALQELDKEVSRPCNIVIVGGAAMIRLDAMGKRNGKNSHFFYC